MRYLNCIEMLNYILTKILKADSRSPVPTSKMNELLTCFRSLKDMLNDEQINDPMVTVRMDDLMRATLVVMDTSIGMTNLTEEMKSSLIDGVNEIKTGVCIEAYNYYCVTEFEPTDQTRSIFLEIAEVAAQNGLL